MMFIMSRIIVLVICLSFFSLIIMVGGIINLINLYISFLFLIFFFFFINKYDLEKIKNLSLFISLFIFIFSLFLLYFFKFYNNNFEQIYYFNFIENIPFNFIIGLDSISILFIVLTTILCPWCILISWNNVKLNIKNYFILILMTEFLLILVFSVLDLLFFYIVFESILIPMFLIIGFWGSRLRRIHAAYQFFFYTFFGSIIMFLSLLFIISYTQTTDLLFLSQYNLNKYNHFFTEYREYLLFFCFFIGFAIKIPMVPFHIWLPEAHVEAPTAGSVLLAGVLLKMGSYGFIRFSIPLLINATNFFLPLIYTICILGILFCSLTVIRQIDLKKIIAYSSIIHMNFALLGLFTLNVQSMTGSIFLMLSHGIVSGGLFLAVGILYERYNTRILKYYNGLNMFMPLLSLNFLILTLANVGFPGTSSFIGEFLVIIGLFSNNFIITIIAALSLIFSGVFSFWLYNRIFFGSLRNKYFIFFSDLNRREFSILFPIIFLIILLGIYPNFFLEFLIFDVINLSHIFQIINV